MNSELIRSLLRKVKIDGKENSGRKYSDFVLAEKINYHTETYLSGNDFERSEVNEQIIYRFLSGDKDKYCIRKPSTPSKERFNAIVKFLTDENSVHAVTKIELINKETSDPMLASLTSEFLTGNQKSAMDLLEIGEANFTSADPSHINSIQIHLSKTTSRSFCNTKIYVSIDNEMSKECYMGWAIITPEDNFLIISKHLRTLENIIFTSIDIDANAFETGSPDYLAVFMHTYPYEKISTNKDIKEAKEKASSNIFMLNRY